MQRTEAFRDLSEFRAEKARLKALIDHHGDALNGYWELMHEAEFRHELANSALEDLIRSWKPLRMIGSLFRSEQGPLTNLLVSFLQPKSRSMKGRLMSWAIGIIAPILISRFATSDKLRHLASKVRNAWSGSSNEDEDDQED